MANFLDCTFRQWDRNCKNCTIDHSGCRSGLFLWGTHTGDCQFSRSKGSCDECYREHEGCCTGLIRMSLTMKQTPQYENKV